MVMASLLRPSPPSLLPLPRRTQPSLLPSRAGGLVFHGSAVTLPSLSLPSRPTRRTLGRPVLASAAADDDLPETTTTAADKLKEWWDSLGKQPSHMRKNRAEQWLDGFETGFCMWLAALLIRMGVHVLVALAAGAVVKFYLNIRMDYREIETRNTIDRIADRIHFLMEYRQDQQRSEAVEIMKSNSDENKKEESSDEDKKEENKKEESLDENKEEESSDENKEEESSDENKKEEAMNNKPRFLQSLLSFRPFR